MRLPGRPPLSALPQRGLSEFALDLTSGQACKGMAISGVTAEGSPLTFVHEKIATTSPRSGKPRGAAAHKYKSEIPRSTSQRTYIGPQQVRRARRFQRETTDKARQWLPVIDHPYDQGDFGVHRYRATAASGGCQRIAQEEIDLGDGRRQRHGKQSVPIATWLKALGDGSIRPHPGGPG